MNPTSIWSVLFWGSLVAVLGGLVLLPDKPNRGGFEPFDAVIVVFGVAVFIGALA